MLEYLPLLTVHPDTTAAAEGGRVVLHFLPHLTVLAVIDAILILIVIPIVLVKKRNPTVAVAWCLMVILVPLLGALLFWVFGYNYVHRRITRKKKHHTTFQTSHPPTRHAATRGGETGQQPHELATIARAVDAFPLSQGNEAVLYHDTSVAYEALLSAIAAARHHVHLEYYILRADETGKRLFDLLAQKAKAGVEVRLLYDSVGAFFLPSRALRSIVEAGGKVDSFLPVNPLRSWVQVNLRNHRKITIIDGEVAFTGGMNIGDEYLGKDKYFGYWRDNFLRLRGPAVASLQRVFAEDWHFASQEALTNAEYYPAIEPVGGHLVQIVESGPDQEVNSIREIYFAAILAAKKRLWIASPYFVPDEGLLDALRLACLRGVDVRLLCISRPDHILSFYAGRYYWADLLAFGAGVWTYLRGMMHCKIVIVDDDWAMTGTANLDNRSLHLNFEVCTILYARELVAELAMHFERDLLESKRLDRKEFDRRGLRMRLVENACRLFAPIL